MSADPVSTAAAVVPKIIQVAVKIVFAEMWAGGGGQCDNKKEELVLCHCVAGQCAPEAPSLQVQFLGKSLLAS